MYQLVGDPFPHIENLVVLQHLSLTHQSTVKCCEQQPQLLNIAFPDLVNEIRFLNSPTSSPTTFTRK